MTKRTDSTLQTLGIIVWYDGWYNMLQEIKKYIEQEIELNKDSNHHNIVKPHFLTKVNIDCLPNIIWSILVLQCGDYGTSPRTGWIEIKKAKDAIKIIDTLCAETEEYQNYN